MKQESNQSKKSNLSKNNNNKAIMVEHQSIEYKQKWQDEYLKWICGFANASGGKLMIGVDDNGDVVGVDNYKDLIEQLPNKFRDVLGVYPKITLREVDGKYFLEVEIEQYSVPISYKGKYYLRSGSTLQELKGVALNDFLYRKIGRSWEAETEHIYPILASKLE